MSDGIRKPSEVEAWAFHPDGGFVLKRKREFIVIRQPGRKRPPDGKRMSWTEFQMMFPRGMRSIRGIFPVSEGVLPGDSLLAGSQP